MKRVLSLIATTALYSFIASNTRGYATPITIIGDTIVVAVMFGIYDLLRQAKNEAQEFRDE